jgi:hypothetical protein
MSRREYVFDDTHDNRVRHYRKLRGYSAKVVAATLGIQTSKLSAIEIGHHSPVSRDGTIKEWADTLCFLLGVEFHQLFPRHICNIASGDGWETVPIRGCNTDETIGTCPVDRELVDRFVKHCNLSPRIEDMVLRHVGEGETLDSVAESYSLSGARVRSLVANGLRIMRGRAVSFGLLPEWEAIA